MKAAFIILFGHFLLLSLTACDSGAGQTPDKQLQGKAVNNKKTVTNRSPKDIQMTEKLQGIWHSNHEPVAMQFFEDGSYRRYIPGGYTDPEAPEEEFDNGAWSVENGNLLLKSENGEKQRIVVSWVEEELIYLGDIEEEYDPGYGSKKEFASELGFSKIKE